MPFDRPVPAYVAGLSMVLVDLGTTGARVEHDSPLGIRREMKLRFEWNDQTLVLTCMVVRCRLQRSVARPGSVAYVSGLRFTSPEEPARVAVRAIVAERLGRIDTALNGGSPTAAAV